MDNETKCLCGQRTKDRSFGTTRNHCSETSITEVTSPSTTTEVETSRDWET